MFTYEEMMVELLEALREHRRGKGGLYTVEDVKGLRMEGDALAVGTTLHINSFRVGLEIEGAVLPQFVQEVARQSGDIYFYVSGYEVRADLTFSRPVGKDILYGVFTQLYPGRGVDVRVSFDRGPSYGPVMLVRVFKKVF